MFIIIKDNSKYKAINLSQEDIRYKGIHFFKKNNIYYIELNNSLYFKDGSKLQKLTLNKYDIVSMYIKTIKAMMIIFCIIIQILLFLIIIKLILYL